jgi:hypothetical protein
MLNRGFNSLAEDRLQPGFGMDCRVKPGNDD